MQQPAKLLICPEAEADLYAYRRGREGATVRIIRGRRCAVMDRCMAEWAAALQFPYVFEGTWESFASCLQESQIASADRPVIMVTNLDRVLPRASDDFARLLRALREFLANRQGGGDVDLVLHAQAPAGEGVMKRLATNEIEYVPIECKGR